MPVTLHQPVAGLDRGDTYSGPMEAWLVVNGYASDGATTDKIDVTGVPEIKMDPQLPANREEPGEEFGGLAKGLEAEEPVETGEREPEPLPGRRNFVVGVEEDADVAKQTEELDGSVDVEEPKEAPVVKKARKAAEKHAGEGDTTHDEPQS